MLLLGAARLNYPGGEALERLHGHRDALRLSTRQRGGIKVHVGVAAWLGLGLRVRGKGEGEGY